MDRVLLTMNADHTYSHDAMKTTFTLRIFGEPSDFTARLTANLFEELDTIEQKLSRYFPGSDVWQINHMKAGERLFISEWTYDCLRTAFEVYMETGGVFDVTLGKKIEHQKNRTDGPVPDMTGQLVLDPERPAVHCIEPGREIDLGGIGKGFALDILSPKLRGGGISDALLSAGTSTHLAFGDGSWPIKLAGCNERDSLDLKNQALSASGTDIQGSHLVSPTEKSHDYPFSQIWVVEKTAARADAWSTAAMLLTEEELQELKREREIYTKAHRAGDGSGL